ncbi:MAG: peptidase M14 family protein, partial [Thermoanaerobaculia bacterium]
QPKMGLIRNLLNRTLYPDNEWTRSRDDVPLRPYDSATHTMAEYMGVRVDPIAAAVEAELVELATQVPLNGTVEPSEAGHLLDGRLNDSFRAANQLRAEGIAVHRVDEASPGFRPGDFVVPAGDGATLERVATATGVDFKALATGPTADHEVEQMRTAMYKRYWGGNMDEGWTRLTLESFDFPYTSVRDAELEAGDLRSKYDVIILPHDQTDTMMGEPEAQPGRPAPVYPPEYRSAIGDEGVEALKAFVEAGGTLVALGDATGFAIEKLELKVRNVIDDLPEEEFFCPGSTVKATFDNNHPLAYGMPDDGLVLFWESPTFQIEPSQHNEWYQTIVRYGDRDLLQSGWLIGEEHIAKKAGMVVAKQGQGRVILIGFRTQNRFQTHGTFKLLFNTLLQ